MTKYSGPESIEERSYRGKFVRAEDILVFGPNLLTTSETEPEIYHATIASGHGILNAVQDLKRSRPDDFDVGYMSYSVGDAGSLLFYGNSTGFRDQLTRNGRVGTARLARKLSPGLPVTARDNDGKEIKPSRRER